MLAVNQVINDTYQVTGYVGSGGGGIVYKAKHLRLETDVVIKQIREEVKDKIHLRQEADILKNLKHPYLPRVYDFLMTEDGVYTVMDFVPGKSLDKILSEKTKISQDMALRWMNQLAEALAYLHEMNPPVIHSDIKPANIIITPENNATLIDFNVSICIDDADKFSVGISAGYAPPEQYRDIVTYQRITNVTNTKNTKVEKVFSSITQAAKTVYIYEPEKDTEPEADQTDATVILDDNNGDATEILGNRWDSDATEILPVREQPIKGESKIRCKKPIVDTRSDVYSLGCVLYHILTGKAPALDFNAIIPVRKLEPQLSEGIVLVLEKMMRLMPEERYQNGKEALEAIRNCYKLDNRYISMKRRERSAAILAGVLTIIGISLLVVGGQTIRKENYAFYENSLLEADALAAMNQYEDAIAMAQDMENKYPGQLKAYERESYYLYMNYRYEDAIVRVEEIFANQLVVEDGTKETEMLIGNLYYILARSYFEIGDYANAQSQIETALSYLPEHADVYRDYALIKVKSGDMDGAQQLLLEAKELGLDEVSLKYVGAEIAISKGDYELAKEQLQSILLSSDHNEMYWRTVLLAGSTYQALQDYPKQIALYTEAIGQADSQNKMIYKEYLAGAYIAYAETGEVDRKEYLLKALTLFEEIRESGYATFQLNENIAILKEETDDFEGAKNQLLEMKETYPDNYRVYKRLAILEADIQQHKENSDRDYWAMKEYYEQAEQLYQNSGVEDMEMLTLKAQMQDVKDGGWLPE